MSDADHKTYLAQNKWFSESVAAPIVTGDPAAAAVAPLQVAAAGDPPPGYKLVRIDLLEKLHDQILEIKRERDELQRERRDVPAFLRAPRPEYIDAVQRGAE